MEIDPHQLIEGIVIAGTRRRSASGLHLHSRRISLRPGYRGCGDRRSLRARLPGQKYSGQRISISICVTHTGAGAYECGEESALMESLEGKRGYPAHPASLPRRRRPVRLPHRDQQRGNAQRGAGHYPARRRMVCRPGHAEKRRHAAVLHFRACQSPGIYELPMGFSIEAHDRRVAGGIRDGKKIEGRDSRRQLVPAAHGRRNRHGHGLRFGRQSRLDARLRRRE